MTQPHAFRLPNAASPRRSDRMLAILRRVNEGGVVPLARLREETRASAATLRRDLAEMEEQGLLVRTRGGARATTRHDELPVHLKDLEARESKHRIAVRTAELVPADSGPVALTGGTTTAEIARALAHRTGLTVVTNALSVAIELAARPGPRVVMTGGVVRSSSFEAVGPLAEHAYRSLRPAIAILGVDGFSVRGGPTTHDEVEARASTAMVEHAGTVVVAADGSKIGRITAAPMAPLDRVDVLVTDTSADLAEVTRLREAGVVVHLFDARRRSAARA